MRKLHTGRWIPACAGMTTKPQLRRPVAQLPFASPLLPFALPLLPFALPLLLFALAVQPVYAQDPTAGKVVFNDWCRPCHDIEPRKHPGTAALQVLYKGEKPAALEQRLDLTPDIVTYYVRNGVSIMPFFRKTEISDAELDALANYLAHK